MSNLAHKVNLGKMGVETGPKVSLTKEEYEAKYGKIDETPEATDEGFELNELQALVRKTLVKLLQKPGWVKGYVQNVKKDASIGDDPDTDAAVKEEIEQSLSEMISAFRKKYKIK
jgi:hypothetical protein